MKKQYRILMLLIIIIFPVSAHMAFSQGAEPVPRLKPDPKVYSFVSNFDDSDWRALFELAYWGSGASGWESAAENIKPALAELSRYTAGMDDRQKGEAVLEYMHEHFLTAYQVQQSGIDTLLLTGRYNCLSSAVLYAIMGTAAGLEVAGVNTIDHAFCSVVAGNELIDVETTNPYGFDPGKKIEFEDEFGKTTGFAYVPPANYRNRKAIDIVELFSLLLQNRIADAESDGRYAEAVGLAVDRWVLQGGGPGAEFEDLIIRMLNYGTLLSQSGREDEALEWAGRGIAEYGPHPKWDEFVDGTAKNIIIRLVRSGRPAEARTRFDSFAPRLSEEAAAAIDFMISDSELITALKVVKAGGSDSAFKEVLNRIRANGVIGSDRINEVELNWRLYRIEETAKKDGWAAAYEAAESAISEMGRVPQLVRASKIYLSNQKAVLYNEAVEAFNGQRYEEARRLTENAMKKFPEEAIFQSLMNNIEHALSGN